jgi:hypothetical protein
MPGMSDAVRAPGGTERFSASVINAMHRSRRDRAIRFLADHAHLLAVAEEPASPKMPQVGRKPGHAEAAARQPGSIGALLAALAIVLVAVHAICAAVIIDRAAARGPETVRTNHAD